MTTPVHIELNALARVIALATTWATQPTAVFEAADLEDGSTYRYGDEGLKPS